MDSHVYDTLILSDLHLGAEMSRARQAMRVLRETQYRRLILNGDIFADLNFARLKKEHWKFLGYIRKLSNPKRGVEVVWVEGNHDHGLIDVMSHLVGVRAYQEYEWEYQGLLHIAVHGHQFDSIATTHGRFRYVFGTLLYLQLQKWDSKSKVLTRYLDRLNTRWARMSTKVAAGALAHARQKHAARIFCGHTHAPQQIREDGIEYYNSGSWVDEPPTWVSVGEQGVQIHEYHERADDHHSGEERSEADSESAELAGEAGLLEDVEYEGVGG